MVRLVLFFGALLSLTSCLRYNEYGYYRVGVSRFSITPNTNNIVYSIIDTNAIYKLYKEERVNASGSLIPRYYKFYPNGRIAKFYESNVNLKKDTILEAKKSYMGYYGFKGKNIFVQFYNSNANASELFSESLTVNKDTLILTYQGIENSSIKSFFIKENIPNHIRITKPDW